jgi:NAD+ kinase
VKIGLVAHPEKPEAIRLARLAGARLGKAAELVWSSETAERLGDVGPGVPLGAMEADLLLALGGDGTFLYVLRRSPLPLLPVHAGTVGFLAEVDGADPRAFHEALDAVLEGRYHLDHRMRVASAIDGRPLPDGTNELVLHTSQVAKMRLFEVAVDGQVIGRLRADGLIVATPTGSTSYALSALGPIVEPSVDALVVTALAPFQVMQRAVVLDPLRTLSIRLVGKEQGAVAVVDGQGDHLELPPKGELLAYRSPRRTTFVRFGSSFFGRLRGKGILPWREEPPGGSGAGLPT